MPPGHLWCHSCYTLILIDAQDHGEGILQGISDAGIVKSANMVIRWMEDPPDHCFVSAQ